MPTYLCGMLETQTENKAGNIEAVMRIAGVSGIWAIDMQSGFAELQALQSRVELARIGVAAPIEKPQLSDYVSEVQTPQGKYIQANISGAMRLNDGMCNLGMASLGADLRQRAQASDVSGVLLRIASGGGEAQAGVHMAQVITDIRKLGKKVVSLVDRAGSAAYMVAAASDTIVMHGDMSEVGSIGALYSIDKQMVRYYAENIEDIYADQSAEKNDAFREYARNNNPTLLQAQATKLAGMFIEQVSTQRNIKTNEKIDSTMKGGMFYAASAIERGLADEVGTMSDAINAIYSTPQQGISVENLMQNNDNDMSILSKFFASMVDLTKETTEVNEQEVAQVTQTAQSEIDALQLEANTKREQLASALATIAELQSKLASAQTDANQASQANEEMKAQVQANADSIVGLQKLVIQLADKATELPKGIFGQRIAQNDKGVNSGLVAGKAASKGVVSMPSRIF